jgi:holo-[acyl-carrier protein] synthase
VVIGIGIDIVDITRINNLLQKYGRRFLERVFSLEEITYCMKRSDSATCLAGRFAVKEAAFKALSAGRSSGVPFKDITINMRDGAPQLTLTGKAHELSQNLGVVKHHVSISHDKGCAVAVVILEGI